MQYTGNLASAMFFTFPLGALSRFSGACVLLTVPPLALPSLPVCSGSPRLRRIPGHTGARLLSSSPLLLHPAPNPANSFNQPSSAFRLWGLACWGRDSSTGRPSRHRQGPSTCPFCHDTDGSLMHHLSACPSHRNARAAWSFPWHLLARCPCAGSAQLSRSTFLPCFLTSFCDSSFEAWLPHVPAEGLRLQNFPN